MAQLASGLFASIGVLEKDKIGQGLRDRFHTHVLFTLFFSVRCSIYQGKAQQGKKGKERKGKERKKKVSGV